MAKDVFDQFKEHSVAEFFKKNRQMLGFSGKIRSMTMIVHEFVTNSLDACEEFGILPEITVQVEELNPQTKDHYRITVTDNGPGIPEKHVGKALGQMLAGTKFHRYIQQRGQQGIGAAACTMFSYVTTGQPMRAISCYKGRKQVFTLSIDLKTNRAVVSTVSEEPSQEHGLSVTGEYKDVRYERSNYGVYEYLRRTALANPHAMITLIEPNNEKSVFPRSVEQNPQKPFEIKPHPLGIGTHDLLEFAKANKERKRFSVFLQETFARMSAGKVNELKSLLPDVEFSMNADELTWPVAEKVVAAFSQVKWVAPATDSLVPIGKEQIEASFQNIFSPEILMVTERSPKVYRGGIPFMVEAAVAYGGGVAAANKRGEIMRFSNRVPLLFDGGGCGITETVKNIDWSRYNLKKFDDEPVVVLVNLVSVHVPYTSAGKQAISNEEDIANEIRYAVMEAARGVQRYISGKKKAHEIATKRKLVSRYVKQLSSDLGALSGTSSERIEKKLERIIEEKFGGETSEEESSEEPAAEELREEEDEE